MSNFLDVLAISIVILFLFGFIWARPEISFFLIAIAAAIFSLSRIEDIMDRK